MPENLEKMYRYIMNGSVVTIELCGSKVDLHQDPDEEPNQSGSFSHSGTTSAPSRYPRPSV